MKHVAPELTPEEFARSFAEIHPPFTAAEAVVEANRCLFCFDAPCTNACPTHIDVPRFIRKIASGNLRGSASAILEANILGLSCARVCPVDVLCEGSCVLHRYNRQPIEIGRLQRHAMDYFYAHRPSIPGGDRVGQARVACIGAGPASMGCAAELRKRGFEVTVFDKRPLPGGLNTYGVAEYKLRPADSMREADLLRSMGVEFRLGVDIGRDLPLEQLEAEFDAIFVGVGLGPTQALGIPGENLPGVIDALQFIAEYKTGKPRVGESVVVVGGGNTAIDAAVASKLLGARESRILYRRGEREMPAFGFEFAHAKQDGVIFEFRTLPFAIHGEGMVEAVECVRMEPGPPDETGRSFPQPVAGSNFRIACDMVILSIGQSRLLELLSKRRDIRLDRGRVVVDPATGQTANSRYFSGGDCVNGGREVVDAVAEGKRAALGIARWMEQHGRT
jgi:dihydropyrimidine dehydrogenase (NAD+) subunit PreT